MNLINNILIPIDFSDSSINAFHYAVDLIRSDRTIKVTLLHVIEHDDNPVEMMEAMSQFDTLKNHLPEFINHLQIIVKHGRLIDTIIETADELKPKIILMGTKGKSKSLIHSESNTSQMVRKLDRSVLVIPRNFEHFSISRIAVAIDETMDDPSDLSIIHDLARWFGAEVHLLTVSDLKPVAAGLSERLENTLSYYMETLDYTFRVEEGQDIVKVISDYIRNHQIDVLAILPKTHAKYHEPSGGKLTRILTLQSEVPLLIID